MSKVIPSALKFSYTPNLHCPKCDTKHDLQWQYSRLMEGNESPIRSTVSCSTCDTSTAVSMKIKSGTGLLSITGSIVPSEGYWGLMLVKHYQSETYVVVEQKFYADCKTGIPNTDLEYYIDEHTCPTNWFKVLMIADKGDEDPHGVFRFVKGYTYREILEKFPTYTRDLLRGEGVDCNAQNEALVAIFPEIDGDDFAGETYEGEFASQVRGIGGPTTLIGKESV